MSRLDSLLQRLPGSTAAKALVFSVAICGALAIPVFKKGTGRQGHDYLSSERPEAITAGQERQRRDQRLKRSQGGEEE